MTTWIKHLGTVTIIIIIIIIVVVVIIICGRQVAAIEEVFFERRKHGQVLRIDLSILTVGTLIISQRSQTRAHYRQAKGDHHTEEREHSGRDCLPVILAKRHG